MPVLGRHDLRLRGDSDSRAGDSDSEGVGASEQQADSATQTGPLPMVLYSDALASGEVHKVPQDQIQREIERQFNELPLVQIQKETTGQFNKQVDEEGVRQ